MARPWTAGELAECFAGILSGEVPVRLQGWEISGCDLGEIEAIAPNGTKYRLTVEIVED